MRKKIIVSLVVMSVLLMANFASRQISARMIIDNRVPLGKGPPTEEPPSVTPVPFTGFEIGDCIFRELDFYFIYLLGHDGIYWHWVPRPGQITPDPNRWEDHITMEALRPIGLVFNNFKNFYETAAFWGVRARKLDYIRRDKLVKIAEAQTKLNPRYALRGGYKRPGISFRCDGFVEWCYEQVGVDIVPNDWWRPYRRGRTWLTPALQFASLAVRTGKFQKLHFGTKEKPDEPIYINDKPVPLKDGKYIVYGDKVKIKIYASDLDENNDGSGITRLELWIGEPDDTPLKMPGLRLLRDDAVYPADNNYTHIWDTTKKDNQGKPLFPGGDYILKAKAYDQAGNYKFASIPVAIGAEKIFEWTGYDVLLKFTKAGTYKIYAKEQKADEEEWKDVDWDLIGEIEIKEGDLPSYYDLKLNYPQWVSKDDDALDMKHGVKVTGLASADDVSIWKRYQWKRLIVDKTEDWWAGELDGITVVDEFHNSGPFPKKGYIKPYFGDKHSLTLGGKIPFANTFAAGWWSWKRRWRGSYNCPNHGTTCPGFSDEFSDEHNEALLSWVWEEEYVYRSGYEDPPPLAEVIAWNEGSSSMVLKFFPYSIETKNLWYYMPADAKFTGGSYNLVIKTYTGKGNFGMTRKLSSFSVSVSRTPVSGNIPSTLEGTLEGNQIRFYLGDSPDWDLENPSWSELTDRGWWQKDTYISGSFNVYYIIEDKGIWSKTFTNVNSDDYENPVIPENGQQGQNGIKGEWVLDEATGKKEWKVTIDFPYEEEPTTWFDRFRYDFKEKKTEPNPA